MSTPDVDPATVRAWQAALAAEHAAVWAYATIAGRLESETGLQRRAAAAYAVHVGRRDELAALVDATGEDPARSEVAYRLPADPGTAAGVRTIAQQVEDRVAVVHAGVVATTDGDDRTVAVGWLVDASTRLLAWGGRSSALPGVEQP